MVKCGAVPPQSGDTQGVAIYDSPKTTVGAGCRLEPVEDCHEVCMIERAATEPWRAGRGGWPDDGCARRGPGYWQGRRSRQVEHGKGHAAGPALWSDHLWRRCNWR